MSSKYAFKLDWSQMLLFGKGLIMSHALAKGTLTLYQTVPTFNDPEKEAF